MMNRSMAVLGVAVLGVAVLTACGGGDSGGGAVGSGTVTGTVGGISVTSVVEAVSAVYSGPFCSDATRQQAALVIQLASTGGHCASAQSGGGGPAANVLGLAVFSIGSGTQAAIGPGTYPISISSSTSAFGSLATVDAGGCATKSYLSASGSITITSINGGAVVGTYNITFADDNGNPNGTLSGSFNTANCAVPAAKFCATQQNHC